MKELTTGGGGSTLNQPRKISLDLKVKTTQKSVEVRKMDESFIFHVNNFGAKIPADVVFCSMREGKKNTRN